MGVRLVRYLELAGAGMYGHDVHVVFGLGIWMLDM